MIVVHRVSVLGLEFCGFCWVVVVVCRLILPSMPCHAGIRWVGAYQVATAATCMIAVVQFIAIVSTTVAILFGLSRDPR